MMSIHGGRKKYGIRVTNEEDKLGVSSSQMSSFRYIMGSIGSSRSMASTGSVLRRFDDAEVKIKKRFKSRMKDIKKTINERKYRYKEELYQRTQDIEEDEKILTNISTKQENKWRFVKSKLILLSVLQNSLTKVRSFGISAVRNNKFAHKTRLVYIRNKKVLYPDKWPSKLHVGILLIVMVYLVVFFPLDMAFDLSIHKGVWSTIDHIITGYFAFDILMSFFTAYYNRKGILIDSNIQIAKNYVTKWFLLDLISVIPLDLIFDINNLKYRRLLKVPRILRLINSMFQNTESKKQTRSLVSSYLKRIFSTSRAYFIAISLIYTLFFIHVSACLWILMSNVQDTSWLDV